jgi:hypothetical protein
MSTRGWHRRVQYSEGPTGTAADRTIERTAIEAAGLGIYQLALVRRGLGEPCVVAYLGGCGRGIGPCESSCLDLDTGEEFIVSSTDPEWEARPLRVTELPPALLAPWPRDDNGRPIRPGYNDSPSGRTVGPEQLRHLAASTDSAPAQTSLFG